MFGGKKEEAPTTGEAIQKLRETENMLLKKQDFLEHKIETELDVARKNGTKNKRGNWQLGVGRRMMAMGFIKFSILALFLLLSCIVQVG